MIIREFKQYSGTLNPRVLISKLHQAIQKAGGNVLFNEKVCRLEKADGLFKVELRNTKTGKIQQLESKRLLIAAGAFNGSLMKTIAPRVDQLIHPQRTCLTFIKINDETYTRLSAKQKQRFRDFYPVAEMSGDVFYSMIEHVEDDGSPLLKVGGHFLRTTVDNLDSVWQQELSPQEIEWSVNYTLTYLAMLNLPVQASDLVFVRGYSCVYALTESEIPLVCHVSDDAHEIDPNCVLIGGMSGVGAKGSLAYGLIAANLLLDKDDSSEMYQKTKLALGAHTTLK